MVRQIAGNGEIIDVLRGKNQGNGWAEALGLECMET
jgi:hypothetical protein